jgi:hypothetical protein
MRYINSSDVAKLLGEEYGFMWATPQDIENIIYGKRVRFDESKPLFRLEDDTVKVLEDLPTEEVKKIAKKLEYDDVSLPDLKKILKSKKLSVVGTKEELVDRLENKKEETLFNKLTDDKIKQELGTRNLPTEGDKKELFERLSRAVTTEKVVDTLSDSKKSIVHAEKHVDYETKKDNLLIKVPQLKKTLDKEFTLDRGNAEEAKIVQECNIQKDNKLHYYKFEVDGQEYKVGCRFDGEGVEIKCRKNRFVGVPMYESVQIHFYMAISKVDTWILKEKYGDKIRDHVVKFDKNFFNDIKYDLHDAWESHTV